MKGSRKTFLLGAGFSKAVADGPVMVELWDAIEEAYKIELKRKDLTAENNNRCVKFQELKEFITKLEQIAISNIDIKEFESVHVGFKENIEYLFTLIDLCPTGPKIQFTKRGSDVSPYPAIPIPFTQPKLMDIKSILLTYLYIIFERLKPNRWADKFSRSVGENDNIITFNYDMVLEKVLWTRDKWSPLGGYAGVGRFLQPEDEEKLKNANKLSQLKIHKMHGSICWEYRDYFGIQKSKGIAISLDNIENGGFHFDGTEEILGREPKRPIGPSQSYAGGHGPLPWILPSFIKPFEFTEFYEIWKSASGVLSKTEELVVIGYSFRPEDSNSWLLMSALPQDHKIILVDPNAENIRPSLENKGLHVTEVFESLNEYLEITEQ